MCADEMRRHLENSVQALNILLKNYPLAIKIDFWFLIFSQRSGEYANNYINNLDD